MYLRTTGQLIISVNYNNHCELCEAKSNRFAKLYSSSVLIDQQETSSLDQRLVRSEECTDVAKSTFDSPKTLLKRSHARSTSNSTKCIDNRCICSCHNTIDFVGRFWQICLPSINFLQYCDRSSCRNRKGNLSVRLNFSRLGLQWIVQAGISMYFGANGYSISVSLRPTRTVPNTSPGFRHILECEMFITDSSKAGKKLECMLNSREIGIDDVNPNGTSLLEVSLVRNNTNCVTNPTI